MITKKDFESDEKRLSYLDAEAYINGLGPDGKYGSRPQIDLSSAEINYPLLFPPREPVTFFSKRNVADRVQKQALAVARAQSYAHTDWVRRSRVFD